MMTLPPERLSDPFQPHKLKVYSHLQDERATLERLLSAYRKALRLENIVLSRTERRHLLKDVLAQMIDESLL
jgi:hypothetical protein